MEKVLNRCVRFVPLFDESRVPEFFQLFEKKAEDLGWEEDKWVLLASSGFKGKALEAYNRLSGEERTNYEVFKSAVLRAYELRPEAYRLLFRNSRKRPLETHEQYAQHLSDSLDKWLYSEQATTVEKIKELILMEQFISGVDRESGEKIKEKRLKVTREAAIWADDHALARRASQYTGGVLPSSRRRGDDIAGGEKDTVTLGRSTQVAGSKTGGTGDTGRVSPVSGGMAKGNGGVEKRVFPRGRTV